MPSYLVSAGFLNSIFLFSHVYGRDYPRHFGWPLRRLNRRAAPGRPGNAATQASEMLGESPANCAFHLRTLAKYGFVEEAGGGKGRERPWRQAYGRMSWRTRPGDEQFTLASEALDQVWLDRVLSRARRSLSSVASWPDALEDDLGGSVSMLYVTPQEARELHAVLMKTFEQTIGQEHRLTERRDPARRPPGAVPVEFVLLGYPILDSPPLPRDGGDGADDDGAGDDTDAGPGG
jgi:hypothetical protein